MLRRSHPCVGNLKPWRAKYGFLNSKALLSIPRLLQGKRFSIQGLLSDRENLVAPTFDAGSMLIFRLAPQVQGYRVGFGCPSKSPTPPLSVHAALTLLPYRCDSKGAFVGCNFSVGR